jgi:hypothetical protein
MHISAMQRLRVTVSTVVITLGTVIMAVSLPESASGSLPQARLVVADSSALTAADTLLKDNLTSVGYTVTAQNDNTSPDTTGVDLVVISPSTSATSLSDRYKAVPVPVAIFASNSWDAMGLTAADPAVVSATTLRFLDGGGPLTAKLPNPVAVYTTSENARYVSAGSLAPGAERVAHIMGDYSRNVVFIIERGAALDDGTPAPARRAVLGLTNAGLSNVTEDGLRLVDNAYAWANPDGPGEVTVGSANNECASRGKSSVAGHWMCVGNNCMLR